MKSALTGTYNTESPCFSATPHPTWLSLNDGVINEKGMAPRKYPLSLAVLNILKLARVNGANPEIGPSVWVPANGRTQRHMSQLYATTANLAHQLYVGSNPSANIAADNFHIEDV